MPLKNGILGRNSLSGFIDPYGTGKLRKKKRYEMSLSELSDDITVGGHSSPLKKITESTLSLQNENKKARDKASASLNYNYPGQEWVEDKVSSLKAGRDRFLEIIGVSDSQAASSPETLKEHDEFRQTRFNAYDSSLEFFNPIPGADIPTTNPEGDKEESHELTAAQIQVFEKSFDSALSEYSKKIGKKIDDIVLEDEALEYVRKRLEKDFGNNPSIGAAGISHIINRRKELVSDSKKVSRAYKSIDFVKKGLGVLGTLLTAKEISEVYDDWKETGMEWSEYNRSRYEDIKKHYKRH